MKERAGGGADLDEIAAAGDVKPIEGLHGDAAWHSAERKVVKSCRPRRWPAAVDASALSSSGCVYMPDAIQLERRRRTAIKDPIEIVPAPWRCSGHGSHRRSRSTDKNGTGRGPQQSIESFAQLQGIPVAVEIEMGDLRQCVDAGIGAAGAVHGSSLPVSF